MIVRDIGVWAQSQPVLADYWVHRFAYCVAWEVDVLRPWQVLTQRFVVTVVGVDSKVCIFLCDVRSSDIETISRHHAVKNMRGLSCECALFRVGDQRTWTVG